jgi:hypothetical protein
MKVNEIITEAGLADLWKSARQAYKQGANKGAARKDYKQTLDQFQKELESLAPEDARELSELRKDYAARPSAAAAQRIASFIRDRAKYVADKENAVDAIKASQSAAAELAGPQAVRVGSYAAPKAVTAGATAPSVDVNGIVYVYDFSINAWKDPDGTKITNGGDISELNKRYYEQSGKPPAGGATPAEIRAAAQKTAQRTADVTAQPAMPAVFRSNRKSPATTPAPQPAPSTSAPVNTAQQRQAAARKKAQAELNKSSTMGESINFADLLWNKMKK